LNEQILPDIQRLFSSGDATQQATAALACYYSNLPQAKKALNQYPELESKITSGQLSWDNIREQ
jgi:hypothetical protein